MKKIILSLALIGLTIGGVTAATVAYFNDTATIYGSTFSSGTLDLVIDQNPAGAEYDWSDGFANPFPAFTNLYPGGPEGSQVIDIMNIGEVPGSATIKLHRTSAWNQLPDNLIFTIYFDGDNNGDTGAGDDWTLVASGTLAQFEGNTYTLGQITGSSSFSDGQTGKMASVRIVWSVPASAGNEIQGDSVTIDTVFGLEQIH